MGRIAFCILTVIVWCLAFPEVSDATYYCDRYYYEKIAEHQDGGEDCLCAITCLETNEPLDNWYDIWRLHVELSLIHI